MLTKKNKRHFYVILQNLSEIENTPIPGFFKMKLIDKITKHVHKIMPGYNVSSFLDKSKDELLRTFSNDFLKLSSEC